MSASIRILGLAGSLRKGSFNRALLEAAAELMPGNVMFETFDLNGIPMFNEDLVAQPPQVVKSFKAKIKASDAVLIATPEYNYSIPGVLKNAIDWASRPYTENVFDGKPVAIMGASTGTLGTARAQYHLRQCFVFLNVHTINKPEVLVSNAVEKFDEARKLKDKKTKELIAHLIENLIVLTKIFPKH